jgi:hypothetical protein
LEKAQGSDATTEFFCKGTKFVGMFSMSPLEVGVVHIVFVFTFLRRSRFSFGFSLRCSFLPFPSSDGFLFIAGRFWFNDGVWIFSFCNELGQDILCFAIFVSTLFPFGKGLLEM